MDERVNRDLNQLSAWFRVLPRLYFFDDAGAPNAYSSPDLYGNPADFQPERNDSGTVLFGITLIQSEIKSTPPGQQNYTVTAILAHELGHTLQAARNNPLPVVLKELQSDFIAGWTVKLMQRAGAPDVDETAVFSSFYKKGDFQFNDPNHHGTKAERLKAFLAGYDVEDGDVEVAYRQGWLYVTSIPIQTETPREYFALNLGIYYLPVPNPDGTYGLKVSRPPAPDSPGGRGGLERGDIILALDSMEIRTQQDVLGHSGETTIVVIDVNTGQRQEGVLQLPE